MRGRRGSSRSDHDDSHLHHIIIIIYNDHFLSLSLSLSLSFLFFSLFSFGVFFFCFCFCFLFFPSKETDEEKSESGEKIKSCDTASRFKDNNLEPSFSKSPHEIAPRLISHRLFTVTVHFFGLMCLNVCVSCDFLFLRSILLNRELWFVIAV